MAEQKTKKRKVFQLVAPGASAVYVAGTFNDWQPTVRPLKEGRDGIWKTTMTLPPGVYEYRFVVDGEWRDDPRCSEKACNSMGSENCLLRI